MHDFLMKAFYDAIRRRGMPDYRIILNAAGWVDKGVLTEDDLAAIQEAMEKRDADNA